MKKLSFPFIFLLPFFSYSLDWNTSFQTKRFIENKSQFDGRNNLPGTKILYAVDWDAAQIYFTKQGLTYRFDKAERKKEKENEWGKKFRSEKEFREHEKEEHSAKITTALIHLQWENANPDAEVTGEDKSEDYFSYATAAGKNSNFIPAYKKLIYKNLYPNIDVEYIFPEGKEGIKYSLILHPGADVSKVKMKYSGPEKIFTDAEGNIHIPTLFGDIIDHAPFTFYESNHKKISSSFSVKNNVVSFSLPDGEGKANAAIIIDPWTVSPVFTGGLNKAWDVETDYAGNVYVWGDSVTKLKKFNAAGAIQWTYNSGWAASGNWIGTLITQPQTGESYVTSGSSAVIRKISTAGTQAWTANGGSNDEYWHGSFNCDYTQLVMGGTRLTFNPMLQLTGEGRAYTINLTNGSVISSVAVAKVVSFQPFPPPFPAVTNPNEIRALCKAPNGDYHFATFDTIGSFTTALAINYRAATTYTFSYGCAGYGVTNQGVNAIAATNSDLYTLTGATLYRRNISTGAIVNQVSVPNGITTTASGQISMGTGGIDIDSCGNVYVGANGKIHKYDAGLNLLSSANVPAEVYDVAVNTNGEVVACGNGFAASVNMSACKKVSPVCSTSSLAVTAAGVNPKCNAQCNGTATATVSSGTSPYTYTWSNGQTTSTATGLCAGNYTVTVKDASGATSTATVSITQPPAIAATTTITSSSCGGNNGSAAVSSSGGTSPYTYSWSSGQSTSSVSNLSAGNYSVTITDANGCTTSATALITTTPSLSVAVTPTNLLCNGGSNGSASANASGGTAPYTYSWSSGQTTSSVSNLSAGTYTIIITDAAGCAGNQTVSISQPPVITSSVSVTNTTCGSSTGAATVTATGGTGNLTYSWSSGQSTSSISNLAVGNYTCTITDANGCTQTQTANIANANGPNVSASSTNTVTCNGGSNGSAAAAVTGGSAPYTYWWSSGQTISSATGLSAGTYTVVVTDASGCSNLQTITIAQPPAVTATLSSTPANCGTSDGTATANPSGGNAPFTYVWNNFQGTQTATGLSSGTYSVIITDANGCSQTFSVSVGLTGGPKAVAGTSSAIPFGSSVQLSSSGGTTYSWFPSGGLSCTNCANPVATPTASTQYCVSVSDTSGCADTACVKILVEPPCGSGYFLPNAFSPNSDGENDVLKIFPPEIVACIKEFKLAIYDRWGEKVFETTNASQAWDGVPMRQGKVMDSEVVVYVLHIVFVDETTVDKQGNVSILK
ncbi:MAG: gliding motility-associated C-terminal domain-containing protein [Bacteroidetes bacterium]|nr:gliding motility-associated C-terminal domain-containing protein [Bacteroidota bacterium]